MFAVFDVPDFLLLAILVKLNATAFARCFRSNKGLSRFMEENKKRIEIRAKGNFAILQHTQLVEHVMVSISIDGEWKIQHQKVPRSYCEAVFQAMCYFKFERYHMKLHSNKSTSEQCPLTAFELSTYWDHEVNHLLRVVQPTTVHLMMDFYRPETDEMDLNLLESLRLDLLRYGNREYETQRKEEYFLSHCFPFARMLQLDVVKIEPLKKGLKIIVQAIRDAKQGRFERLYIYNFGGKSINLGEIYPSTAIPIHNCNNPNSTATDLAVWMISLPEKKFILFSECKRHEEHRNGMYQLDVVLVKEYDSLILNLGQWEYQMLDGILDIEQVWATALSHLQTSPNVQ